MNIFQYIQGIRTGKEANHIEYEAMKDPFLADALDGYTEIKGNHKRQIEKLQSAVTQKCKKKTNYSVMGGIAAVVVVVLGIGVYFLVTEPKEQIQPVIENNTEAIQTEPEPEITTKQEVKPAEISEKKEDSPIQPVKETPATQPIVSADPPEDNIIHIAEQPEQIVLAGQPEQTELVEQPEVQEEAAAKPKIKGKVTDKNGNPLTGASVSVPGANIRTITNASGYFELEAENNSNIMIRSLGYDPVILTGSTSENMQVTMEEVPKQE